MMRAQNYVLLTQEMFLVGDPGACKCASSARWRVVLVSIIYMLFRVQNSNSTKD
jgi:hypothetical protein